jgi:hypothetical protein
VCVFSSKASTSIAFDTMLPSWFWRWCNFVDTTLYIATSNPRTFCYLRCIMPSLLTLVPPSNCHPAVVCTNTTHQILFTVLNAILALASLSCTARANSFVGTAEYVPPEMLGSSGTIGLAYVISTLVLLLLLLLLASAARSCN